MSERERKEKALICGCLGKGILLQTNKCIYGRLSSHLRL